MTLWIPSHNGGFPEIKRHSIPRVVVNRSSPLIDNIYTNITNCWKVGHSGVLEIPITDHYPILNIFNKRNNQVNQTMKKRELTNEKTFLNSKNN